MDQRQQLQDLCEIGQVQLMRTEYLRAETTLRQAELLAVERKDFDTLSRLYLPLQEARRQRRQRCGEGIVCLDLIANGPDDHLDGRHVVENFPQGQLLVAGWGSIEPALKVRELQARHELYLETFLGAVYPVGADRVVVIVPLPDARLPDPAPRHTINELRKALPTDSILLAGGEICEGSSRGTAQTFAKVMSLWERLHAPFLARADATANLLDRINAYRKAIQVDYACELAHQKLAATAREYARRSKQ